MESRIRIGLYSACVVVLRFRTGLKDRTWVPPPLPLSSAPSPLTHSLTQGVYVTLVSCISACCSHRLVSPYSTHSTGITRTVP